MNLFAYTCPYMENAMFIKSCYKLLQCLNQCITVVAVSLDTFVMCPRKPLPDTDLPPLRGVKTPQPLKHFLKEKLVLVSCDSFRN